MSLSKWVEDLFRGWNQPDDKEEEVKALYRVFQLCLEEDWRINAWY